MVYCIEIGENLRIVLMELARAFIIVGVCSALFGAAVVIKKG